MTTESTEAHVGEEGGGQQRLLPSPRRGVKPTQGSRLPGFALLMS